MSYNRPGRDESRRHSRRRHGERRAGFTMVEILTAVAIIALLVTMTVLGFKYVKGSQGAQASNVALQNARNMLADYEARQGKMADLIKPYTDNGLSPLPLSSVVIDPDNLHQYTTPDIINTAYVVMPRLRAVPENKAIMDSLPPEHVYPRRWSATKDPTKKPPYSPGDMRSYQQGERVQSANGFYKCTNAYTVSESGPNPPEMDGGHWVPDAPNFLILDAHGVPIIFVPPLGAVNLVEGTTDPTGKGGVLHDGKTVPPKQAPDRKGYFMSAGEDHNYATGDDNLYSFENK